MGTALRSKGRWHGLLVSLSLRCQGAPHLSPTSLVFAPQLVGCGRTRGGPIPPAFSSTCTRGKRLAFVFLSSGMQVRICLLHPDHLPGILSSPCLIALGALKARKGRSADTPQCHTLSVTMCLVPGVWLDHAGLCCPVFSTLLPWPCWVSLSGGGVRAVKCQVGERVLWRWGGGYLSFSSAAFDLSVVNIFTLFWLCVPLFI